MNNKLSLTIDAIIKNKTTFTIKPSEDHTDLYNVRFCKGAKFNDGDCRLVYKQFNLLAFTLINSSDDKLADIIYDCYADFKIFYKQFCEDEGLLEE